MAWFAAEPAPIVATIKSFDDVGVNWEPMKGAFGIDQWQKTAWELWRRLGELHYPTTQMARLVSRVNWISEPDFDLDEVTGPDSVPETARLLALNLQVAGDVWYIHTDRDADNKQLAEPRWQVISTAKPKWNERVKQANIRIRVWVADPVLTDLADSPLRSVIGPARELVALESQSRSQARSRLSQGILLRPTAEDGFSDDFRTGMITPLQDEDSVASVVPMDIETNDVEAWKFLTLERPYDEDLPEKMERAIRRIALGLDIHPELLLGIADMNHWSSWLLQEDTWNSHVAPVAGMVADVFATAREQLDKLDAGSQSVEADPSELLARRSTVRDALDAAGIGAVDLAYVRTVIGASEDDAPSDDELRQRGLLAPEPEREPRVEEQPGPPQPIAAASPPPVDDTTQYLASIDDVLAGRLRGLLDAETARIRARIGARVRSAVTTSGRSDLLNKIDATPNDEVVATLTLATVEDTATDVAEIIATSVDDTVSLWVRTLRRTLGEVEDRLGIDLATPDRDGAIVASGEHLRGEYATWLARTLERTNAEMPEPPDGRDTIRIAGSGM